MELEELKEKFSSIDGVEELDIHLKVHVGIRKRETGECIDHHLPVRERTVSEADLDAILSGTE